MKNGSWTEGGSWMVDGVLDSTRQRFEADY